MLKSDRYHGSEYDQKPVPAAITMLGKSCARILRKDCDQLAQALFDQAKTGHVGSIKLLVELIDRVPAPKPRKKKKKRPSFWERLATSPEWTGPIPVVDLTDEEPIEGVFDLGDQVLQAGADPAWPDPNYPDLQTPQQDAEGASNSLIVVQQAENVVSLEAVAAFEEVQLPPSRVPPLARIWVPGRPPHPACYRLFQLKTIFAFYSLLGLRWAYE